MLYKFNDNQCAISTICQLHLRRDPGAVASLADSRRRQLSDLQKRSLSAGAKSNPIERRAGSEAVGLSFQGDFEDWYGQADRRAQLGGDGLDVGLGPGIDLPQLREQDIKHLGFCLHDLLRRQIKLRIGDEPGGVGQNTGAERCFCGCLIGIPNRPGVDRTTIESGQPIGRNETDALRNPDLKPPSFLSIGERR